MRTRTQKTVRLAIRLLLPLLTLGGLGSIAGLIFRGLPWETRVAVVDSPQHRYRVEVVRFEHESECGEHRSLAVRVVRHRSVLKTGESIPFCLFGEGSIHLHWRDATTLEIGCSGCEEYQVIAPNWGRLHYSFDLNQP